MSGRPYRYLIHSPGGWLRLLEETGFHTSRVYLPCFSYQYPLLMTQRANWKTMSTISALQIDPAIARLALGRWWRAKGALMAVAGALHLPVSHSVVLVC